MGEGSLGAGGMVPGLLSSLLGIPHPYPVAAPGPTDNWRQRGGPAQEGGC